MRQVRLVWVRFDKFVDGRERKGARDVMGFGQCVYAQTDSERNLLRVGSSTNGLDQRYHGGTGGTIEAASHGSGNLFFVAFVDEGVSAPQVERTILTKEPPTPYNRKYDPPLEELQLIHEGNTPKFQGQY